MYLALAGTMVLVYAAPALLPGLLGGDDDNGLSGLLSGLLVSASSLLDWCHD